MPENIEKSQQIISSLINNKKLDDALSLAKKECLIDNNNSDKWLLLASVYSYKKDIHKVEECCLKSIAIESKNINAHYNLAIAQHTNGNFTGAEKSYNTVLTLNPGHAKAYSGLAQLQLSANNLQKSLESQLQALILEPDNPQFHYKTSLIYQRLQQFDLVNQHLHQTLHLAPDHIEALNDLGSAYHTQGKYEQAMQHFTRAIKLQPNYAKLHYNISQCYWQQGNIDQAFLFSLSALQLNENQIIFRQHFIQTLSVVTKIPDSIEIINQIIKSYSVQGVNWQDLLSPSLVILNHNKTYSRLIELARNNNYDAISNELESKEIEDLLTDKLLLYCLTHTVITTEKEELLFTLLRQIFIYFVTSNEHQFNDNTIRFMSALACQNFNNEYAFVQTDSEIKLISNITNKVKCLNDNPTIKKDIQSVISVLAMYIPLSSIDELRQHSFEESEHNSDQWDLLILRQIIQPREELLIKKNIMTLSPIENKISKAVQEQYEDSPYPRWVSMNITKPQNYQLVLSRLFPYFTPPIFSTSPLEILIAGCGTGSHAVISSSRFSDSRVLAIDLSRQSIAYAQRMVNELEINNVRFAHADILNLSNLNQRFHLIESIGVLHHMDKPEDGLTVLRNLLHKDGLINLGFYSTIARRHITEARSHFKDTVPTEKNLRIARQELLALNDDAPLKSITKIRDFYSLSECRDLLFHTQEHCYSITEIKRIIHRCGLRFIGFELATPSIKNQYVACYPEDKNGNDLDNWEEFETTYPNTFIGMYTFWCQRNDTGAEPITTSTTNK